MRRRLATLAAGVTAVAALAGCVGTEPPEQPSGPTSRSAPPGGPGEPGESPALAGALFTVGPPEIVMGPSTSVDSPLTAVKVGDTVRAYVGNVDTVLLEGSSVADLVPTGQTVLDRGRTATDFDWCGAWLDAVVRDKHDPDLLHAWYHAEAECRYADNQTHKSIAYAESRDGGRTFTKPDYPHNQVVRSPTSSAAGHHTGRGAPSVVRRGRYLYMYYLNVLPDLSTVTSVARAPVSSGGVPGSWRNYTEDGWTASALDGPAAALDTTVPASSASIHTPSGEVVLMRQNSPSGGIVLQASTDGIHFSPLPEPLVPYLRSQVRTDWSAVDDDQIIGYVSAMAADGSRTWSDEFYLFHMYVFPGDALRGGRYLVRRRVVVTDADGGGPRSTIALSAYTDDASDDRFATSAPVKPGPVSDGVLGYLAGSPGSGRTALFECTSPRGDRFVSAGCGAAGVEGRLVGYAFAAEQRGTVGLFRCVAADGDQFASLDPECESTGRKLSDLGFVYPPSA